MGELVLVEKMKGLAVLTLNRPGSHNAIDAEMASALRNAVKAVEADESVRVVILTGAGRSFCAGMDLSAFLDGQWDKILFGENRFAGFVDAPVENHSSRRSKGRHLPVGWRLPWLAISLLPAKQRFSGCPR